jgi:outer membrane murein-binding lipoprotein Lpp
MNASIRNIFLASLISASIIGSAALATPAAAQSVGDIQKQIQELLAKLAALQEQLKLTLAAHGGSTSGQDSGSDVAVTAVPRICKIFPEHALALGARGEDVLGLQEFLKAEGYFSSEGTGFFGPLTRAPWGHLRVNASVLVALRTTHFLRDLTAAALRSPSHSRRM